MQKALNDIKKCKDVESLYDLLRTLPDFVLLTLRVDIERKYKEVSPDSSNRLKPVVSSGQRL